MKIIYNWLASIQFVFIFAAFLITADVRGDIILGAPGVPIGMVVAPQVPFNLQYQLPSCYRFVFLGIQAKGNTLGSPGIKGTNDQFSLKASVRCNNSTPRERAGNLYFRNVDEFNSAPLQTLLITPGAVFKAENSPITITTEWQGNGNAHKPNGWFNILGEYQKNPPPPVGSLNFEVGDYLLVNAGVQLQGTAIVMRN